MNTFWLWLIKCFNPIWRLLGINLNQFHAILKSKLTIDGRRKTTMFGGASMEDSSYGTYLKYFFLFLIGALILLMFKVIPHFPTGLTIYFTIWMVLLTMSIVVDYSDILVSSKDNYIILPTPCLLYTSPSPRDQRGSRMPSSA